MPMRRQNSNTPKRRIPLAPVSPAVPSFPNRSGLSARVEDILAGSKGFVIDPLAVGTLFQDGSATVPVTAVGQRVQTVNSRFGSSPRQFSTTVANRPSLASGGRLLFDNAGTQRLVVNTDNAAQDVPGATIVCRCELSTLATQAAPWNFSNGLGGGQQRITLQSAATTGDMSSNVRRLDADVLTSFAFAGGFVANTPVVITQDVNFATTGAMRIYRNGTLVASSVLAVTTGNSENTPSFIVTIGSRGTTDYFFGFIGRLFYAPFVLSDAQRAIVEAWVAE